MKNSFSSSYEISLLAAKRILKLAFENKVSHVGGALSVVDIIAVLYTRVLRYKPNQSNWVKRDRLFYSKGHACTALYSILHLIGFYDEEQLNSFTKNGSIFTSHVSHRVPGVELSTGSLGHALGVACGVALSGKLKKTKWNVYVILSDGELDEGSNWEAILFASHHQLDNLIVIVDYNKIQSFGFVDNVLNLEPLQKKIESFGWQVFEVDGHSHVLLMEVFLKSKKILKRPVMIIAHTIKGKGVPFMENELAWHYKSPDEEQVRLAIEFLDQKIG